MTYLQLQPIINICSTGWAGTLGFFPEDIVEEPLQFLHHRVEQTNFNMAGLRLLGGAGCVEGVTGVPSLLPSLSQYSAHVFQLLELILP